jgi:hypothetical protein
MITREEALERLGKERNYEDHLVDVLSTYLIQTSNKIEGLSTEQLSKVKEGLDKIRSDSTKHSILFNNLMSMILEDGKNYY